MKKLSLLITATLLVSGCSFFAVQFAPEKKAATNRSENALIADELFWKTFHNGEYENIDTALNALTAAYLETPNDAITAAHVGFLHIWKLSERPRLNEIPATITDHAALGLKYFKEANALNPKEARFEGFYGSLELTTGSIHNDQAMIRQGYYRLKDSVKAWPEFNNFTAGYSMSRKPVHSDQFKEALEMQWDTLDICFNETVNRKTPNIEKYLYLETTKGSKRACWNSWIASHNFEGFFLNMGDMLVKSGDQTTAKIIYNAAKLSQTYEQWPYKSVLEQRLNNIKENTVFFNDNDDNTSNIMINTSFSCMACHQK